MTTVLVTGGSGVLGRHVVSLLRERGDEVRVLSRRRGRGTHVGDLARGNGLAAALDGVGRVVHAATDSPTGRADLRQTESLLSAAVNVSHLLYVSVVGIDRMPYAYYAQKLACEEAIAGGAVPYTILRATQFHELLERGLRAAGRLPLVPLPLDWQVQPVAAGARGITGRGRSWGSRSRGGSRPPCGVAPIPRPGAPTAGRRGSSSCRDRPITHHKELTRDPDASDDDRRAAQVRRARVPQGL